MYVYNAHYMFALTTHCVKIGVLGGGGRLDLLPASIGITLGGGGGGGGGGRVCF